MIYDEQNRPKKPKAEQAMGRSDFGNDRFR